MTRAPQFHLVDCPGTDRALAFGLRWHALIGTDVAALARSRGRRLRATHYVVAGSPATVAGYGRGAVRRAWRWRRAGAGKPAPRWLAAAQLFALRYPDGGHSLVRLPDGQHWLVAAYAGTVLSQADRLFDSHDEALREHARLLLARPELPGRDGDDVYAALLPMGDAAAQLAVLPSRWNTLPRALRLFLACLALSVVAPALWRQFLAPHPRITAPSVAPLEAAEVAARARLAQLNAIPVHGPNEIARVLVGLVKVPIEVQGWALRRAQCDAQARHWTCRADYARAHPQATNQGLFARLPRGWRVSFNPLEDATLSWQVASDARPLVDLPLPTPLQVDTGVAVTLQKLRPAFSSIVMAPAVLALPAAAGMAAASAAAAAPTPAIRSRAITLAGPLRSFALLPGRLGVARWSRLALNIQPQLRSSLAASTLVAELQGVLYEQE